LNFPSGAGTSANGALARERGVAHLADSTLSPDTPADNEDDDEAEAEDELKVVRSQEWRYVSEQSQLSGLPGFSTVIQFPQELVTIFIR
jgi:hypothetical protein